MNQRRTIAHSRLTAGGEEDRCYAECGAVVLPAEAAASANTV